MTRRRGALYFNPSSGARDPEMSSAVRSAAEDAGLEFVELQKSLDVQADIRARMAAGERMFIASGGDGTIHTVAQPLIGSEATLGILPTGTFNHFARDLKIPLDWREALEVALQGEVMDVDTAKVNEYYFLNNISIGIYPEIVEHREQFRKLGKWKAYRKAVWQTLRKLHHVSLVVESEHNMEAIRTHVFLVSVNPYDVFTFGLIAPRTTLGGGQLCAYWLPHMQKIQLIRTLARYFRGKMEPGGDVRSLRTAALRVQTSRSKLKVGMDGELYEMKTPLVMSLVPMSLRVKVPRTVA